MRNYLTIAGKDSREFGVYISGQGTFSAPEKAYEFYNIPGRNGAILGNDHRLENIEVSYECFIYSDFSKNIADFRTFLLSLDGYQRLQDSYHPDEFRMAVYVGPFEPVVTEKNDAGSFTLTFNCKPQRYLISGESTYNFNIGSGQDVDGDELLVFGPSLDPDIFVASGAWHEFASRRYIDKIVIKYDDEVAVTIPLPSDTTEFDAEIVYGTGQVYSKDVPLPTNWTVYQASPHVIFKTQMPAEYAYIYDMFCSPLMVLGNQPRFYNLQDWLNRVATVNPFMGFFRDFGDLYAYHKDYTTAADFNNYIALNNAQGSGWMDASLLQNEPFTFTPGFEPFPDRYFTMSVEKWGIPANVFITSLGLRYLNDDAMSNPTMFPAEPLIRVYGTGAFEMDGVTVTITNCNSYVDIDCEMMDCYEGTINRNKDVTFSTYDFPKLQPGSNEVTILNGITAIQFIPRWWRV